ncbi:MAG: glycosyltransferase family 2 protein [Vallitalea sp.]|jgi:glycosyltransferase involved in cell wall biosynthesis|nr:glycosyltransferase family 2 protein [Vallitalea sp.]
MNVPMVCFITWNRAGIAAKNLTALLNTKDDFELHIVDNNSKDNIWDFIVKLDDKRIKSKTRLDLNRGVIYARNYVLKKRKKDQFFIMIDDDVCLYTPNWISEYMKVMNAFPQVGLLGALRDTYFKEKNLALDLSSKEGISYYPYEKIIGCCVCIRPEVFNYIGYFNEETYGNSMDTNMRVNDYTPFHTGIIPTIKLKQPQSIKCSDCVLKKSCPLANNSKKCYQVFTSNAEFAKKRLTKNMERYLKELKLGKRTVYCASIHDHISMEKYVYHKEWAEENFRFFIEYAN